MSMKDWKDVIGRRYFFKLKDGSIYNCKVTNVESPFIYITDKFGNSVFFAITEVSKAEELIGEDWTNGKKT